MLDKKKPRAEGRRPGTKKRLNLRKAPAQGGEAGDDKHRLILRVGGSEKVPRARQKSERGSRKDE